MANPEQGTLSDELRDELRKQMRQEIDGDTLSSAERFALEQKYGLNDTIDGPNTPGEFVIAAALEVE